MEDGILYRGPKTGSKTLTANRFVTPVEMRVDFFRALHHGQLGGHQGVNKTLAFLKGRFYWPRMGDDVM